MTTVDVYSADGKQSGKLELPPIFSTDVKPWLISRAVVVEQSRRMQPQGHFVLAGMQTTAAYYGAMMSYRSGRHVGRAIRPREKLGGGAQGKVRRIPSSTKGKRAHPHQVEKVIHERMNDKEYRLALSSAVAATSHAEILPSGFKPKSLPIIVFDSVESIKKTKDVMRMIDSIGAGSFIRSAASHPRKGVRRSTVQRQANRKLLLVVGSDSGIAKAARNIPGMRVAKLNELDVSSLAPGANHYVLAVWTESAIKGLEDAVRKMSVV